MNINKIDFHRKPTYAEMVKSTITNPTDKIDLPDRYATRLRNTPQMTRYDDESFLELTKDNQNIMVEQMKQTTVRQQAAASQTATHTVERATGDDAVDAEMPQAPPAPPPPAPPKFTQGSQTQHKLHTSASSQTFHHPPRMVTQGTQGGPGDQPPQPPAPAVAVTQDITQHLQREREHNSMQMNHIQTNMEKMANGLYAGIMQHMGPKVTIVTQAMDTGGSSSSAEPMDQTTGQPGGPPGAPPGAGGALVASGPVKRNHGVTPYGKAGTSKTPAPEVGPSQPPPGPGPGGPPPPPIALKMETDTRSKKPAESIAAGMPKKPRLRANSVPAIFKPEPKKRETPPDETKSAKKLKEAEEEVIAISNITAKRGAPPKDGGGDKPTKVAKAKAEKPERITKPRARAKAAKPASTEGTSLKQGEASPPPPPPPTPPKAVKNKMTKEGKESSKPTPPIKRAVSTAKPKAVKPPEELALNTVIKQLIQAKRDDKLTELQTTQFEALVREIRVKGPAVVQKRMRAELNEILKTQRAKA